MELGFDLSSIEKQNERLKILMIAPQPWFQPRGTPFSVLHRIRGLTFLGHQVDLATYHIGKDVPMDGLRIMRAKPVPFVKNVKIGPSKTKIFLDMALYNQSKKILNSNEYDLIHTHEEAAFWGINFAKKKNLPHLYDMHSSLPQQLNNFKYSNSKIIKSVFDKLEDKTILNSQAMITICPELQNYVNEKYPEQTSILIENVADNALVFPPTNTGEQELREKYNLGDKKIVLYFGTFEHYQGLDMLVNGAQTAIDQFGENIHYLLVGGHDWQVAEYEKLVKEKGLEKYFTLTGFVQPELIPTFVSMSDVLVTPRMSGTNSPLKIYSYLRSGKPIVATDHITHTQILDETTSVLTDINPTAFAQGIVDILKDAEKAKSISDNAKKLAEAQYGYKDYLQKLQLVLDKTLENFK